MTGTPGEKGRNPESLRQSSGQGKERNKYSESTSFFIMKKSKSRWRPKGMTGAVMVPIALHTGNTIGAITFDLYHL